SQHTGKIVLDPRHKETAFVACMGPLWGDGGTRGVLKTTDGGKTWANVLPGNAQTGAVDIVVDPSRPDTLIAALYQRQRKAYRFSSGGRGSGLFKSTDGGKTWRKLDAGLPNSEVGRIGLSYYRKDPRIVMAVIEAATGGGVYRSEDGGEHWVKMTNFDPRPFYFSKITIDPNNDQRVYLAGVSLHVSDNGGRSFRTLDTSVHVDHHAIWVDPLDSEHILIGEDGGVGQSRDMGKTWDMLDGLRIGQFYAVAFDYRKPYYVYGGLQDNGSWGGPTQTNKGGVSFWDWFGVGGGDGFYVQVDPEDWRYVYSESQGGAATRYNLATGEQRGIRPRPAAGEKLRFNWDTPIHISPWNSKTVYIGGNKLFKSINRGDDWKAISPDLSTGNISKMNPADGVTPEDTGAERHCTIVTVQESPRKEGVIWAGTDDGLLNITQDGGQSWQEVSKNIKDLPPFTWCSRVEASHFNAGRAFVTYDGHRNNDFTTYVYGTDDYGKTWKRIAQDLPAGNVAYVIREGTTNPDLLMLGTEMGLWISLDRGVSWNKFHKDNSFPTVRVDDIQIHPREREAVIGTHGRSIWIIPVSALEQFTSSTLTTDVTLFKPETCYALGTNLNPQLTGDRVFVAYNSQPLARVYYFFNQVPKEATYRILDASGTEVASGQAPKELGMNAVNWSGRSGGRGRRGRQPMMTTSDFTFVLKVGDKEYKTPIRIEDVSSENGQD
ncbi:MAG: glycosyl hydrolase, partial [Armatimonadota bacterium]